MQTRRMGEEEAPAAGQPCPYIFASTKADGHTVTDAGQTEGKTWGLCGRDGYGMDWRQKAT